MGVVSRTIMREVSAYRWGEDAIAGFRRRRTRLWCLGLSLWNGHDPISKSGCSV